MVQIRGLKAHANGLKVFTQPIAKRIGKLKGREKKLKLDGRSERNCRVKEIKEGKHRYSLQEPCRESPTLKIVHLQ